MVKEIKATPNKLKTPKSIKKTNKLKIHFAYTTQEILEILKVLKKTKGAELGEVDLAVLGKSLNKPRKSLMNKIKLLQKMDYDEKLGILEDDNPKGLHYDIKMIKKGAKDEKVICLKILPKFMTLSKLNRKTN